MTNKCRLNFYYSATWRLLLIVLLVADFFSKINLKIIIFPSFCHKKRQNTINLVSSLHNNNLRVETNLQHKTSCVTFSVIDFKNKSKEENGKKQGY